MKKTVLGLGCAMILVPFAHAGIVNVTTKTFNYNTDDGSYTQFVGSVEVGDYVVVVGAANKAPTQTSVDISQTVGGGTFDVVSAGTYNGGNGNQVMYSIYEATGAGNNNRWTLSPGTPAAGITANVAIYHLRADSGVLSIADHDFIEDGDGSYNNGGANVLNYSFGSSLNGGFLIEAGANTAGAAGITNAPAAYTYDNTGGSGDFTRFVASYAGVSGSSWSSEYLHTDPGSGDRTVTSGWVVSEVIPEPATLGTITLTALGMLFVRRRFML